jgi:hypothetical protein
MLTALFIGWALNFVICTVMWFVNRTDHDIEMQVAFMVVISLIPYSMPILFSASGLLWLLSKIFGVFK